MARRKIVAGNWKMNKTPSEAVALVNELKPLVANDEVCTNEFRRAYGHGSTKFCSNKIL